MTQKLEKIIVSPVKNKKYRAIINIDGKSTHVDFGDTRFAQYRDSTGLNVYSNMDHNDKQRRARYYARHSVTYPKFSADWLSKKYLW